MSSRSEKAGFLRGRSTVPRTSSSMSERPGIATATASNDPLINSSSTLVKSALAQDALFGRLVSVGERATGAADNVAVGETRREVL
jgi:hypothetical protein